MMRLVIRFSEGDGYTYSCTQTVPVVYESAEAFAVDFEIWCHAHVNDLILESHTFAGTKFYAPHHFENGKFYLPEIMTIDEWFEECAQ